MPEPRPEFGQRKPTRVLPAYTPHQSNKVSATLIVGTVVLAMVLAALALL